MLIQKFILFVLFFYENFGNSTVLTNYSYQFNPIQFKGTNIKLDIDALANEKPHIIVGTPGRVLDLSVKRKILDLSHGNYQNN